MLLHQVKINTLKNLFSILFNLFIGKKNQQINGFINVILINHSKRTTCMMQHFEAQYYHLSVAKGKPTTTQQTTTAGPIQTHWPLRWVHRFICALTQSLIIQSYGSSSPHLRYVDMVEINCWGST